MSERQQRETVNNQMLEQDVNDLFNHTMDSLDYMNYKDLTTIILSMAKIVKNVRKTKLRRKMNNIHQVFGQLLLNGDPNRMEDVFDFCAMAADRTLPYSDARHISNLAYAYALVGYDPQLGDRTLLVNIGDESVGFIQEFNGQDVSNMVWAFATLNVTHPVLFQTVGHHIEQLDDLESFKPQELSNIIWAYATAGVQHPTLFKNVGDHIVALDNLKSFEPQAFANTVWAFATAGMQHPALFKKVSDHVAALDNLKSFNSQDFANTVWAYATAGVQHPDLFRKVGEHIITFDNLKSFTPQALSNTV
jgi:hypothetical protein